MDFKFCNPDANSFDKEVLLTSLEEWSVEYVALDDKIGYWIADNPFLENGYERFKHLVSCFPIVTTNNIETCSDPNPFATIHLPTWLTKSLITLIKSYYVKNVEPYILDEELNEWGNLYWKDKSRPVDAFRIPHVDYEQGYVANLWFSDHALGTTGTNIYKYTGKIYGIYYDFQVDNTHKLYKKWNSLSTTKRLDQWVNFSDDEAAEWGFVKLGMAPSIEKKITMYKANIPHCPYISNEVDFRWSHTFAISHKYMTLGSF